MPWSGSAPNQTFTRTDGTRTGTQVWQEADGAGVDIVAPDHDIHDQDIATALSEVLKKDGGNQPTADLPMGGYVHTNVGDATARDQYTSLRQHVADSGAYCTAAGTANAITLTTGFSLTSVPVGARFTFKAVATSTGAVTVAVDSLAAVSIVRNSDGSALGDGDIRIGAFYTIRKDTSTYRLEQGTASAISGDIYARIIKTGSVLPWTTSTIPDGWLECDGAAISRTTYAELFGVISTTYGVGDGSTTFNLPDYRGEFLRGKDGGTARDPDRASRTNRGDGTTGDAVGTKQGYQAQSHTHSASLSASVSGSTDYSGNEVTYQVPFSAVNYSTGGSGTVWAASLTPASSTGGAVHNHSATLTGTAFGTTGSSGGNETRPRNVNVIWIILASPAAASAGALGVSGFSYAFDSGITDADPGAGKFRFNNATVSSATGIYISETDGYGANLAAALQAIPSNSNLYIYRIGAPSTFAFFTMGATATDAGTYDKLLSLTYVAGNGSFANGVPCAVIPMRAGATGLTGVAGADGGLRYTFDATTTMADPGVGEFRVNDTVYAGISQLAISAQTAESGNPDFSAWVETWDDSTTTADRGQILLRNQDGTAQVVLSITGAITDNTSWLQVPVTPIASSGTLSGTVLVSFARSGNAGAGSGDVTASSNFANDNRLLRADGTLKGAQASAVTVDDSGNMSGVGTLGTSGEATIGTTAATAIILDPSGFINLPEVSAPSTPSSGFARVYAKSDGKVYRKNDAGTETELGGGGAGLSHGQCYLAKSGSNLVLTPYNGNKLIIDGAEQTVPDAGVTLGTTSLSINTTYYIYAYMSGATMTLEASATAPARSSTTGVQIKTADATRTLVGQARTIAGPVWVDTAAQRFVLSYFNRRNIVATNMITSSFNTTSTSFVEILPSNRAEFITWGEGADTVDITAYNYNSTTAYCYTKASFDGGTSGANAGSYGTNGYPVAIKYAEVLAAGYHYGTGMGAVVSGTGTWTGSASGTQTAVFVTTRG